MLRLPDWLWSMRLFLYSVCGKESWFVGKNVNDAIVTIISGPFGWCCKCKMIILGTTFPSFTLQNSMTSITYGKFTSLQWNYLTFHWVRGHKGFLCHTVRISWLFFKISYLLRMATVLGLVLRDWRLIWKFSGALSSAREALHDQVGERDHSRRLQAQERFIMHCHIHDPGCGMEI